jgi:lipid-A-disaccharide synthase
VTGPVKVMLVAAEASGDRLGAKLARALKAELGADRVRFIGVGGPEMAEEGVDSPFDIHELSVLGLTEALRVYPRVVARADQTAALAAREKPDIAVLIDSWGFTLRVAQRLKRSQPGLPIVKYVGPQVWATRPGRARTLARAVDHLLTIHAFDAPYFETAGLTTTFVGNPTLARGASDGDGGRLRALIGAGPEDPVLLLLPGSRAAEIERLTPPFEQAVALLKAGRPDLHVVLIAADAVAEQIRTRISDWRRPPRVLEGEAAKNDAMRAATVALACSGTVTTELALAGCPMIVAYRVSPITALAARILIRTRYITLLNIAADAAVAPELLQEACTGPALAAAASALLDDPERRARQIAAQNAALDRMGRGGPDPSARAAEVIAELVSRRAPISAGRSA